MYKIAVVILNWNGKAFLEKFLPSVVKFSNAEGVKVVVADNASSDDSVDYVKSNFANVELIVLDNNYGFAGGYNRALEQIKATYFVLLNSDVEVTTDWINPIVSLMDSDTSIGACMPKILAYDAKERFEYAGAAGGFIDKYGYPFCRGRIISEIEMDSEQYNTTEEVFWASGAAMFVRADAYKKAGGLDDDFFAHMEEIDLCWRLKRMGYKVMVEPKSVVYHVGGGTLPNNNPRKIYLNYRNSLFLLIKNLPSNRLIPIMLARMLLDGMSAFVYLGKFYFSFFIAVIKAHIHFYGRFGQMYKKRKAFKKVAKAEMVRQVYPKSVVFSFYIRGKKKFSDLIWDRNQL